MEKIPFESQRVEGQESVMLVEDLRVSEIRFKHDTREIFVCYEEIAKYTEDDLVTLSWREIKTLVLEEGGDWSSKKTGIAYLLEVKP